MYLYKSFFVIALLALSSVSLVSAQQYTANGTSILTFNKTSVTLINHGYRNVSVGTINYTVSLSSGASGYTYLSVQNVNYLQLNGIIVVFSKYQGVPPFSGKMTVQASNSTFPGNYNVTVALFGADPSANTIIAFRVPPQGNPSSSTTAKTTSSNYTVAIVAVIIVVAIAAIIIFIRSRRKLS